MQANQTDNEALLDAITIFRDVAAEEGWQITLEKDEGALFYSPEEIPAGSVLRQVTDEFAIYVDDKMRPRGVVIEYFGDNFMEHHPKIKQLNSLFEKNDGSEDIVITRNELESDKQAKAFKELLESTLFLEAFSGGHCICDK